MTEAGGGSEVDRARQAAEERSLVESAVRGSQAAFERLYRNHVGKVYGLCVRMTGNAASAEDCTQEAFIQAWRSLHRFERRSSFGTWLHRIAVNTVLSQARRRRHATEEATSLDEEIADSVAHPSEPDPGKFRDLEAAIGSLPDGARRVLVLAGLYGYSHEETAAMLGIAVGTCKAQLHRARQLLAARLGDVEEGT